MLLSSVLTSVSVTVPADEGLPDAKTKTVVPSSVSELLVVVSLED